MKSSKRFILSDSSLNKYGFRILTEGADLEQFKKNPIMLFMHTRSFKDSKDQVLPLGNWDDIEVKDGTISAVPVFDDNDEFAMKIADKVESGIFRMASAGVEPLSFTDNPKLILPGQKLATVDKWKMYEASIVDIGANDNALALYSNGNLINLNTGGISAFIPQLKKEKKMDLTALISSLELAKDTNPDEVLQMAVTKLVALNTENVSLKAKINDLEKKQNEERITRLLDTAVAQGKIITNQKDFYAKLAANDFETTQKLIESIPAYKTVKEQLDEKGKKSNDKLFSLSWDELDKGDKLAELKSGYPEVYMEKFKEKFGKEPE
ncbi:MAG: hypothetical protein EPN37_04475 [Chitinophagaceae bacterium]|nr:MAG: hypothetical protein EPN37_04475 [Chitinophagaceae bacterium]